MTEKYWKLTPNIIEHRAWARSTLVEEIIVIAESEQEARKRAGVFLDKAYKKENIYEDLIVVRPWEEEELVTVS